MASIKNVLVTEGKETEGKDRKEKGTIKWYHTYMAKMIFV